MRSLLFVALATPVIAFAQPVEPTTDTPSATDTPLEPPVIPIEPAAPPPDVQPMRTRDVTELPPKGPYYPVWYAPRIKVDLELYTHARYAVVDGDNLSELRLDRGELGTRVGLGHHAAAELRLEAIRSAPDGGALGIDGDSTVVRVKYANVAGAIDAGPVLLEGALGFVPDPWIRAIENGYTLKPISRTGSERLLGWQTADLAASVRATLGPARLSVTVGNGEGQRYPERNDGKTTTAVAEVVAYHAQDTRLIVLGMGRDGSIGVSRIRDRRAGGGLSLVSPRVNGGVDVVRAWGIGDMGAANGTELGGWVDANVVDKFFVGARFATLGYSEGGRSSTFGGALGYQAFDDSRGQLRLSLALDRITNSDGAMPLPGADAGDATVIFLVASATAPYVID